MPVLELPLFIPLLAGQVCEMVVTRSTMNSCAPCVLPEEAEFPVALEFMPESLELLCEPMFEFELPVAPEAELFPIEPELLPVEAALLPAPGVPVTRTW